MTRIPTTLALSVILVLLIIGVMFYLNRERSTSSESTNYTPKQVIISNIGSTFFTVSWFSASPTTGTLSWGKTPSLGQYSSDDREAETPPQDRLTHTVTVDNLEPNLSYYFKMRNGPFFFPEKPLEVKTTPPISPSAASPIIGKVTTPQGTPLADGLVFLQTKGSSQISTYLLPESGNFLLPLSEIKNSDLASPFALSGKVDLLITNSLTQSIVTLDTPTNQKLPTITLGQNYDLATTSAQQP